MRGVAIVLIMMVGLMFFGGCREEVAEDVTIMSLRMKGQSRENLVYKLDGKAIEEEELFQELSELAEKDVSRPIRIDVGPAVSAHVVTYISERLTALGFTEVQIGK